MPPSADPPCLLPSRSSRFSRETEVPVPLKSNRCEILRAAWSTALRTSCRSTSDTMSNENWSFAMRPILEGRRSYASGDRRLRQKRWLLSSSGVPGRMPEWPKGAACKIAGVAYGGSNPPPPTTHHQPTNPLTNRPADHSETSPDPRPSARQVVSAERRPSTNASDGHICSDLPLPLGNARCSQVGRIHQCDRCHFTVGAA